MPSLLGLGLGKVGSNSHPIHPVTVHLPIAFLMGSSILELLTYLNIHAPGILSPIAKIFSISTPTNPTALTYGLSLFAYAFNILGLITTLPALSSGLFEGYAIIKHNGLDLSNSKVKTMILHAGMNDLVFLGALYNFWLRKGGRIEDWKPSGVNALLAGLVLGSVAYSGYLGGKLVYEYGVGVQRMGTGKEIKEEMIEGEREKARKEL